MIITWIFVTITTNYPSTLLLNRNHVTHCISSFLRIFFLSIYIKKTLNPPNSQGPLQSKAYQVQNFISKHIKPHHIASYWYLPAETRYGISISVKLRKAASSGTDSIIRNFLSSTVITCTTVIKCTIVDLCKRTGTDESMNMNVFDKQLHLVED